jgi:hypothetical protein
MVGVIIMVVFPTNENSNSDADLSQDTTEVFTTEDVATSEITTEQPADTQEEQEIQPVTVDDLTVDVCKNVVAELHTKEASNTDMKETLLQMSRAAVQAKVCNADGVIFSQMATAEQNMLNYEIINATYGEGVFSSQLQVNTGELASCNLAEADSLFEDTYGCKGIAADENGLLCPEDELLYINFADGDIWYSIYSGQVRENENYYMLSGPYFYGSNGDMSEWLQGYVDVLFIKNESSRFGVTMAYAATYTEEKKVVSVDASSRLESQEGKTYEGSNLIDGDYNTAWVEGVNGVGEGESVTLHLQNPTEVYGVLIYNGYLASADLYEKNGKVSKVRVDFGNGVTLEEETPTYELYNSEDEVNTCEYYIGRIELDTPVITDTITITILEAQAGTKYDDTCMSEVEVY